MHGHISAMNMNQLNSYYAAAAAEKAAAAQRALEVRRKLLGQSILLEKDEFRVSEESDAEQDGTGHRPTGRERAAADESAGDDREPISMWA